MARDATYVDLVAALAKPGCAICRMAREAVHRYLDGLLYENVNDVGTRARLRAAHGFCHVHAWQAAALRDAFGMAIIYRDVVGSLGEELQSATDSPRLRSSGLLRREPRPGQFLARRLAARRPCPACSVQDEVTDATLGSLVRNLNDPEMERAFSSSSGLCLPHLRRALALAEDSASIEMLVRVQRAALARLEGELSEFIRKHDYRFAAEEWGPERDSWRRAIAVMTGEPDQEFTTGSTLPRLRRGHDSSVC